MAACSSHGGTAGAVTRALARDPRFRRSAKTTRAREALARAALAALADGTADDQGTGLLAIGRLSICHRI
jgi:anti-sigma factor RsiW